MRLIMEFTFGIVTDGTNAGNLAAVINSIRLEQIPSYEIIVVGGPAIYASDIVHIPHDEKTGVPAWLCYKKNRITDVAKYDRIVYLHDYVTLVPGWYQGFLNFGDNWHVCMTRMVNPDGRRYRDWVLDVHGGVGKNCLLPYDVLDLSYYMYFSGAYWVAKKHVMCEFPLDETLDSPVGLRGEDCIWSRQVNTKYEFSLNVNSTVRLLKQKGLVVRYATQEVIDHFRTRPQRSVMHLISGDYL